MKKTLLSFSLVFTVTAAQAGDEVIAFSRSTSVGVLRDGGNLYRPIPRGGTAANLTGSEMYRATIYRPTQHYYLKDNVVSYRYTGDRFSRVDSVFGGTYFGPHNAQFIPLEHQIAPNARLRSWAAVNKRPQPGVPMVSRTTTVRVTRTVKTAPAEAISSIQLASATVADVK